MPKLHQPKGAAKVAPSRKHPKETFDAPAVKRIYDTGVRDYRARLVRLDRLIRREVARAARP